MSENENLLLLKEKNREQELKNREKELNIKELELHIKLKKMQENANYERCTKGTYFERKVAEYFVEQGYNIFHHGAALGINDNGIDIIAYGQNDILFIQCKYRSSPNTLTKDVYEKAIEGYYTIINNAVMTKNATYKLILACNSLKNRGEKLSPVSNELFQLWIKSCYYDDNNEKNNINDGIKNKEIYFFEECDNGDIIFERKVPEDQQQNI